MKLPLMPIDKANHFVYGFVIFVLSNLLLTDLASLGIVSLAAISKEIRDQIVYKGFSMADAVATLTPGVLLYFNNTINKI